MNLLQDIITYVRRIVKTPSNAQITDDLIVDYINRFWLMDVDARIQLFDLKTKYQFMTVPGVDQYNMPLYTIQNSGGTFQIGPFPVYQGFMGPVFVNGIEIPFHTERAIYNNIWPEYIPQTTQVGTGDGTNGPYTFNLPFLTNSGTPAFPPYNSAILRGHVDITGIIAFLNGGGAGDPPLTNDGALIPSIPTTSVDSKVYFSATDVNEANVVVQDSGQFFDTDNNCGLLMQPGDAPFGNATLPNGYTASQNCINYISGVASNVYFPVAIPSGNPIYSSTVFYQLGLPRSVLFFNNVITLRAPPDRQYIVELDAYLSPAAFLNTADAVPFAYMSEYLARGAARKILSDLGDVEQFNFYEPLFQEQELLVWKRSERIKTSTRTQTIYSAGLGSKYGALGSGSGIGAI